MAEILVVDDDENICNAFRTFLTDEGHHPIIASNAADAVRVVESARPDLVIMDVRMPGVDGLECFRRIRVIAPDLYVVIMTAYASSQTSIEAMRLGAFDLLAKPIDLDDVRDLIAKVLSAQNAAKSVGPSEESGQYPLINLIGNSPAMHEAYKLIGLLVTNDVQALLVGAKGTGKLLAALTIHANSNRKDQPFVTVNCRSVSDSALEQELFGPAGKFAAATGGTLLLEEITSLTAALQIRLFNFLTDNVFKQGGQGRALLDVRVLATTEKEIADEVRAGTFNEGLFDLLNVITIYLPPLRDRKEDIPDLVNHFIRRCNSELRKSFRGADAEVLQKLAEYAWPGNVGQLENVIKRACILGRGEILSPDDVATDIDDVKALPLEETRAAARLAACRLLRQRLTESGTDTSPFHEVIEFLEQALVEEALEMTSGNQVRAAEILGLNRTTLRKKMRAEP